MVKIESRKYYRPGIRDSFLFGIIFYTRRVTFIEIFEINLIMNVLIHQ